jgi:hypothetical protein
MSQDGTKIFHIGIIDYLQEWNFDKKLEALSKSIFLRKNKDMISALNP